MNNSKKVVIDPEQSVLQVVAVKIVDGRLIRQPIAVRLAEWSDDEIAEARKMIDAKLKEFYQDA